MLPRVRLGDGAYRCERCHAVLPKQAFANIDWRGGGAGEPRYQPMCGSCQVDEDDGFGIVVDNSAWLRAEREVERRYGIPSAQWLSTASPLAVLWLRLAQQYAAEQYSHLPAHLIKKLVGKSEITVADAERLCEARGFVRRKDVVAAIEPIEKEDNEDVITVAVA